MIPTSILIGGFPSEPFEVLFLSLQIVRGSELAVVLTHAPSSRPKEKVSLFGRITTRDSSPAWGKLLAIQNFHSQTIRRLVPAHKENEHEAGRAKKLT